MMSAKLLTGWVIVGMAVAAARAAVEPPPGLESAKQQMSYALGVNLVRNAIRNEVDVDPDSVLKGIRDALSGEKLLLSEEELRHLIVELQTGGRQQQARARSAAEANRQRGETFLAGNRTKDGVVALANGIQYKVLKAGEGKKPAAADTVQINYRGTLLDGKEFISSKPDLPGMFKVEEAFLPALKEVLPLMPLGAKWRLWVPPQFAYGSRGVGRQIGPNETIVFDVELVGIK